MKNKNAKSGIDMKKKNSPACTMMHFSIFNVNFI